MKKLSKKKFFMVSFYVTELIKKNIDLFLRSTQNIFPMRFYRVPTIFVLRAEIRNNIILI